MDNFTENKLAEFEDRFVADDILDCIPLKNWVEMRGEVKSFIAQALQEKDEAHKAKIARIREAVIESKDFSGTHSDGYYGYCRQLKKTLSAFNSAVNGKE